MKTVALALAAALVPLALLTACGSSVTGGGGNGGTTTSTNTNAGGGTCDPYSDFDGPASVTVNFKNETGLDIYLPMGCSTIQYSITPPAGTDPSISYSYDSSCLQTCADLMHESQYECGACLPQVRKIAAGATYTTTWDGTGLTAYRDMPAACWMNGTATSKCASRAAAPTGTYTFGATAYDSCGTGCTCSGEVCNGDPSGPGAQATPVTLTYPGSTTVDVIFPNCAFGCPG